ncbi:MAG: hypothetical protein SF053_13540 [Bacteroidia bacterium]|nr:hypothetical protein [Bacteroidia bacterium]
MRNTWYLFLMWMVAAACSHQNENQHNTSYGPTENDNSPVIVMMDTAADFPTAVSQLLLDWGVAATATRLEVARMVADIHATATNLAEFKRLGRVYASDNWMDGPNPDRTHIAGLAGAVSIQYGIMPASVTKIDLGNIWLHTTIGETNNVRSLIADSQQVDSVVARLRPLFRSDSLTYLDETQLRRIIRNTFPRQDPTGTVTGSAPAEQLTIADHDVQMHFNLEIHTIILSVEYSSNEGTHYKTNLGAGYVCYLMPD